MNRTILTLILIFYFTIVYGQTKMVYVDYYYSNNAIRFNSNCNECSSEGVDSLLKLPNKNKVVLYDNLINNILIITKGQNSEIKILGYNHSYGIDANKYFKPYTIHKIESIKPILGKKVKIYIYENYSNKKLLVDSIIFVPQTFKFQINLNLTKTKSKSIIKSSELLITDSLTLKTDKSISPKIIGFEINWYGVGMDGNFKSTSNHLTSEMKDYLKNSKTNKTVYLENIKIKMPDNTIRVLDYCYKIEF